MNYRSEDETEFANRNEYSTVLKAAWLLLKGVKMAPSPHEAAVLERLMADIAQAIDERAPGLAAERTELEALYLGLRPGIRYCDDGKATF